MEDLVPAVHGPRDGERDPDGRPADAGSQGMGFPLYEVTLRRLEGNAPSDGVKAHVPVMLEDLPALILPEAGRVVIVRKRIPLERGRRRDRPRRRPPRLGGRSLRARVRVVVIVPASCVWPRHRGGGRLAVACLDG
jgi:hypothetical protein